MTPINFPQTPSINDIHEENGLKWIWTGITWDKIDEIEKTPVDIRYPSKIEMISDQSNQTSGYIYYDGNEYWEYLGTTFGTIIDYKLIGGDFSNFVPYTGATRNVNLGEYGITGGYFKFDTTPTDTPTDQGVMFWDIDDNTVDIILNGYKMKVGEDIFYPVKNQTGSLIPKGTNVRFAGTLGSSGRLLIELFLANGTFPSIYYMGVTAEDIADGGDGKVLWFGRIRGINTDIYNEGDILYASTTVAGGFQTTIPQAPNNIISVAAVISKSVTQGTIFIRPQIGSNINNDEGVRIVSGTTGQLLQLQSNGLWENRTLGTIIGGTSTQFLKGDGSLDSTVYEPVFTKGSIIQGAAMSVTGTLTNRLVGTGDITIAHLDTSTLASITNINGTIIQSLGFDTYGHVTSATSLDGDLRWLRQIEVLNTQSVWSHVSLTSGIDITQYTTGSSGYPTTLGVSVAFYATTSDSTSGFGRAFALTRGYNTRDYYFGSPNTSGVHNGWDLVYTSHNLSLSTLGGVPTTRNLTINGVTQDLSADRTYNVGIVHSLTTTGTTGNATLINNVLNIPNYTYTHANFTVRNITLTGATVLATYVSNNEGHTTDITTRTLTLADLGYTGAANANNYVHPAYTTRSITATGAQVLSTFTSDDIGSVTGITTRTLTPADIGAINVNQIGVANGITPLDSGSKIPLIHLPDVILGQVKYISTWNAATNTPTLPDPTTVKGNYYVVSVDGIFGGKEYKIGDWIISDGTQWDKVDNTDSVTAVFGRIGNIIANATDYSDFYVRHDTAAQGLNTTQQTNARTNINAQITITGGASTITTTNLTVNRALISDGSGKVAVSTVTSTELGFVSGVTSSIQTQLNTKLSENQIITLSGDVTGSGSTSIVTTIANNVVTDAKIRQSVGYSVIGRSLSTTGNVANIVAGVDSVLRRSGTGDLLFGTLVTNNIGDAQVTYTKIQNVSADRILGRITTLGVVQELTAAQIRTLINVSDGANNYIHPLYTAINQTLSGATVLSTFTTDTIGSVTSFTTRTLTAADISAVPTSRTLTFTTNNGITGGTTAVDLSANRSFTFGLTGQALALHNLATNGFIVRTGTNTVTTRSIVGGTGVTVTNGDGISGNPTISITGGTYSFDEETFTYTGSTNFTLSITTPFAVEVYLNGQRLVKTLDWTISGNIVTVTAPLDTLNPDEIVITYFYNTPDIILPGLTGSGTTNFLTKWGSSSTLTSSSISDNGSLVSITLPLSISAAAATIDTDKFMVLDGTTVKYRTGSQILSDIGAPTSLNGLSDVIITTPSLNQVLQYNGTNWINNTLSSTGGGITWNEINSNTNASFDNGYIANSATRIEITLPSNPTVNKPIKVLGRGSGGWRVNIPIGSTLFVLGLSVIGWIESTDINDAIEIISTTDGNYLVFIINGNIKYNI
jgi:hypothetical protein